MNARVLLSVVGISAWLLMPVACGGEQEVRGEPTDWAPGSEQTASLASKEHTSAEATAHRGASGLRLPERCLDKLPGPKPGYCGEVPEHARAPLW